MEASKTRNQISFRRPRSVALGVPLVGEYSYQSPTSYYYSQAPALAPGPAPAPIPQAVRTQSLPPIKLFSDYQAPASQNSSRVPSPMIPGTEYSLGCDTCLNVLSEYCDAIKQSASSSRKRVFVVEVQGGNCGYVASYIGLISGAVAVYRPEHGICLKDISSDLKLLDSCFAGE